MINIYTEKHHIFPVSIFGKNKKIVRLTPKEHYIAHWLLYKICFKRYGKTHSYTRKMANALIRMISSSKLAIRIYPARYYDIARNIWRKNWINPMLNKKNRRYGENNHMYNIGTKHPMYGKHHSEETKNKIGKSNKGKLLGDKNPSKRIEVRKKISQTNSDGRTAAFGEKNGSYLKQISKKDRELLIDEWNQVQKFETLYSFAKRYSIKYQCSMGGIQSIVYKSPKIF
ncbi:MAG: NUMOD3 domain-containing DNA-binding protein [Candidatus Paceibacterota bacterium]